jgi:hypothetical protein
MRHCLKPNKAAEAKGYVFYTNREAIRGKKLSLVSWDDNVQIENWVEKLTEAYGFPTASTK